MRDLSHDWGSDLVIGSAGDLLTSNATTLTRQRILRRLLTNLGDYIWQLSYGAGLARYVGMPRYEASITAVVREQLRREPAILRSAEPRIKISPGHGNETSMLYLNIDYVTASENSTDTVQLQVGS